MKVVNSHQFPVIESHNRRDFKLSTLLYAEYSVKLISHKSLTYYAITTNNFFIQILMISTCSLLKRMLAVSRTFDVMNVESETTESFQTIREAHEPTNSRWSLEDI